MSPSARPWLTAKSGDPKGPAPWEPKGWRKLVAADVLDVVAILAEADALPVGPRTIGYRLSMRTNASGMMYVKEHKDANGKKHERVIEGEATFDDVTDAVKRLRQAGEIPWSYISDGGSVSYPIYDYESLGEWLDSRLDASAFGRDLRHGQPVVTEIYVESAELTPLIAMAAARFGVRAYSGRGSAGPDLARETAERMVDRWNRSRATTLILGIGDLDLAGVQNVMRPHLEHVGAFLLDACSEHDDPFTSASRLLDFRRIAVTPEHAMDVNEALGIPMGALGAYRDSGECDWTRDVRLLKSCPKTEVEALNPVDLRHLIRAALENALDLDALERVRSEQETERQEIQAIRDRIGLDERDGRGDPPC